MRHSFVNMEKPPVLLGMSPVSVEDALQTMALGLDQGAEGFCIQMEDLIPEQHNANSFKKIIDAAGGRPVYATDYRPKNRPFTEDELAKNALLLADCGADLVDVLGDLYDPQPFQMSYDPAAVEKQMHLVEKLHEKGVEVLMSAHVQQYRTTEQVMEIALAQQARGADVVKMVTKAENMDQQLENLRTQALLKQELKAGNLFLSNGECRLHRRVGPMLGACMYLCRLNHEVANQPTLASALAFRDNYPW